MSHSRHNDLTDLFHLLYMLNMKQILDDCGKGRLVHVPVHVLVRSDVHALINKLILLHVFILVYVCTCTCSHQVLIHIKN
jgi:hypothetical protein